MHIVYNRISETLAAPKVGRGDL